MSVPEERLDSPIEAGRYAWPDVDLDPVERMRALTAGLPHVAADETVLEADFDRVWAVIEDFERFTPRIEAAVGRVRILEREGERIVLLAKGPLPSLSPWQRFDVVLRPGWCLMASRLGDIGMAARPEGPGRTRFFHFEGSALFGRLVKPLFAWNIRQDFRKIRGLL
ncbi:MAG: hypothetical protein AAGC67_12070 [Myxococcota bacterium]